MFIPNYSELTSLLTDLTKKEAPDPVQWTELCQYALTRVKAALCGEPLLHTPNFDVPFVLQTDALDSGLGEVLSQVVGGEERPVLYLSWKLSNRETRYSTIEKECLAIHWSILTLCYYLLEWEFILYSVVKSDVTRQRFRVQTLYLIPQEKQQTVLIYTHNVV